jgi:signal transduction histidine kinase
VREAQHGKLISLGTMAAGLAHELNNPAAIGRSAAEAREAFQEASEKAAELGNLPLTKEQRCFIAGLPQEVGQKSGTTLDSLEVSDLEDELAMWMEDHGVEEGWEISPTLAGAGLDRAWLEGLAERVPEEALGGVLGWLSATLPGDELLREIEGGSARISELVGAIKTYTHMDKAASKKVDIHEGLNSTLTMLGHKLKKGDVEVVRDFEKDLPHVCGHAGELNQVWTNLLDNAIDAVDGRGSITVRAYAEGARGRRGRRRRARNTARGAGPRLRAFLHYQRYRGRDRARAGCRAAHRHRSWRRGLCAVRARRDMLHGKVAFRY